MRHNTSPEVRQYIDKRCEALARGESTPEQVRDEITTAVFRAMPNVNPHEVPLILMAIVARVDRISPITPIKSVDRCDDMGLKICLAGEPVDLLLKHLFELGYIVREDQIDEIEVPNTDERIAEIHLPEAVYRVDEKSVVLPFPRRFIQVEVPRASVCSVVAQSGVGWYSMSNFLVAV